MEIASSFGLAMTVKEFLRKTLQAGEKPLLVLLGPTASGKTALSIELAKEFKGEIISADSRQVYCGMDIGTDKISESEHEKIPHFLLDIVNPDERFTVAEFKKLAEEKIEEILQRGHVPMLVGGTGLYLRAITENFSFPSEDRLLREKLNEELKRVGSEALHEKLQKLDPENAAKIHPKNARFIVRAIEIYHITGGPKKPQKQAPKWKILQIGLRPPADSLFERIHARVDAQIERGLIDETKSLLAKGYSKNLPSMSSLGYCEMIQYLEGILSLEEAAELLKKNTTSFAKRQMTWFKKDRNVIWFSVK